VVIGYLTIGPVLFGDFFKDSIIVDAARHPAMAELAGAFHGAAAMALHSLGTLPLWLAVAGVASAWWFYLKQPAIPAAIKARFAWVYRLLDNKYYMDWFNEHVLAAGARLAGRGLWKGGDVGLIDGVLVDGSARAVGAVAQLTRRLQSGYLYMYALVMLLGLFGLMTWQLWPQVRRLFGL
jgi:NADH-quinone oxidoreductase subunit L